MSSNTLVEFDFAKYSDAIRTINMDDTLTSKEKAIRINTLDDRDFEYPFTSLTLEQLRTFSEQLHINPVRSRISRDIERTTNKSHVGYFITCTLRDNEDTPKLKIFLNKILKSKFSLLSKQQLYCYELTESGHLHFHVYLENPNRLQTSQLRKLATNSGLDPKDYNLQNKPVKTNNGISSYINKCQSLASYEAYCIRTNKTFEKERVTDLHTFLIEKDLRAKAP